MSYSASDFQETVFDMFQSAGLIPADANPEGSSETADLVIAAFERFFLSGKPTNAQRTAAALAHLAAARDLLKAAGARRTLTRVRHAISSAKGARRHARLEPYRNERRPS